MDESQSEAPPRIFMVLAILIVLGVIADAVDVVAYRIFLSDHGVGWFDVVPWKLLWEYTSSPLGATLTILAFLPWLVLLAWLHLKRG